MMKNKIGLDLDGVIVQFAESYLEFYNKKFGTDYKIEDWKLYDFSESFGIPYEESVKIASELFSSPEHNKIPLVKGAKKGIRKLSEKNDLCIITSRPKRFHEKTKLYLENNLPNIQMPIFYSDDVSRDHVTGKTQMCRILGIETFVEDNLEYAIKCSKNVDKTFLLNNPWNQGYTDGVIRVNSWDEVLEVLEVLK